MPPLNEKPKAGADRRGRNNRTTRTRRSTAPAVRARPEPDVVDAVDVAYIVTAEIKKKCVIEVIFHLVKTSLKHLCIEMNCEGTSMHLKYI